MRKTSYRGSARSGALAAILFLMSSLASAKADVAWTRGSGSWQVALYLGARGDPWCSLATEWQDGTPSLRRQVSFQMRGDEVVLFLFVEGDRVPFWSAGAQVRLEVDGRAAIIVMDLARILPNGVFMSRGIVVQGSAAQNGFAPTLSAAALAKLQLPGGTVWPLELIGMSIMQEYVQACLHEVEARIAASERAVSPAR